MIKSVFKKDTLFIPFIMAGHPTNEITKQAIVELIKNGADIIELGVPFSDPSADGRINQKAAEIALKNGMTLNKVLTLIKDLREQYAIPFILLTYLNPILAMGVESFAVKAQDAGVNGILIVDLPPEEGEEIFRELRAKEIESILLISPTTNSTRFRLYHKLNPAFIYYISRCGVTGVQNTLTTSLEQEIVELRKNFPIQKIAVGFGISTPNQAQEVAQFADGVIIGSVLVKTLEENGILAFTQLANQMGKVIKDRCYT